MEPLDLRKFLWTKNHKWYVILAITDFEDRDVVVHRETDNGKSLGGAIGVTSVERFMSEFTATYQVRH